MIDVQNSEYGGAETKMQRTAVVSKIVEAIRANGVGFVKQEDCGEWYGTWDGGGLHYWLSWLIQCY
jgi:hypothetical protein